MPKKTSQVMPASPAPRPGPVTVTQQPVIACALCEWTRGYDPATVTASATLTDHYIRAHAAELTSA